MGILRSFVCYLEHADSEVLAHENTDPHISIILEMILFVIIWTYNVQNITLPIIGYVKLSTGYSYLSTDNQKLSTDLSTGLSSC